LAGIKNEETSLKLHTNSTQTSYKLHTNFTQTSHKLHTNFTQTSHKLHANFNWVLDMLLWQGSQLLITSSKMPLTNNEFNAYLEDKAKADGFVETEKHEQRRPNYFIDE
jgi:hypothetical protein